MWINHITLATGCPAYQSFIWNEVILACNSQVSTIYFKQCACPVNSQVCSQQECLLKFKNYQHVGVANGDPQRRSQAPFKQLGEFWGEGFNLGLISGGKISLGTDWWEALAVRVGNANASYREPVVICWLAGPEFSQNCLLSFSYLQFPGRGC